MNLLELAERIGVHGFLHCDELDKLVELAAGRDVLEIGSFRGLSAWGMAITAKSLTCVDTFRANSAGQVQMPGLTTLADFLHAVSRYNNVRWLPQSSESASQGLAADIDPVTSISISPESDFDMIFLDAMHTYDNVRDDIARWWPRVRPGGVFVMHDYRHWDFPDVERAADEVFGPAPDGTTMITLRWIDKP